MTLFGFKLSIFNLGLIAAEPSHISSPESYRAIVLLFGFFRNSTGAEERKDRVQHLCRFLHAVVMRKQPKNLYKDMMDMVSRRWDELYGPNWKRSRSNRRRSTAPQVDRGPQASPKPEDHDCKKGNGDAELMVFEPNCNLLSPIRWRRPSWNPIEILMISILFLVAIFQLGFTFLFPFIAVGYYWERQTTLLKGLFGFSVLLLVLMVPLLPRLLWYARFWLRFTPLIEFATTCTALLTHSGAKNGTGKGLPLPDAAIQDFYVPPHAHEWAIIQAFGNSIIGAPRPNLALLPSDIVHRLSAFSSIGHLELSELSRREAKEMDHGDGACVTSGESRKRETEDTPLTGKESFDRPGRAIVLAVGKDAERDERSERIPLLVKP
jgi:hypothetical protein